jgi:GNAT superfamily N-acetyltransferase
MKIEEISFDEILPFWKILWSHIDFEITPKHPRDLIKGFIDFDSIPTFFGAIVDDKIVGVNSGFRTNSITYRSRGLFVIPEYRKRGIATNLLEATYNQAKKESCKVIWSYPRYEAIYVYLNFGFKKMTNFEKNPHGTNCYVMRSVI